MQEVPAERETKVLKTSHPRLNIRKVERGVGKPTNKRKLKQGQPKEIFDPCATRGEHHRPVPLRLLNVHDADDADAQSNFRGPSAPFLSLMQFSKNPPKRTEYALCTPCIKKT